MVVSGQRSPCGVGRAKALLGLHAALDPSMVLLEDVVQILNRSIASAPPQDSFGLHFGDRRTIEAGLIGANEARLRMRGIAQRLVEQALGHAESRKCRHQEIDRRARGSDGAMKVHQRPWTRI